jgi:hypothetical protein
MAQAKFSFVFFSPTFYVFFLKMKNRDFYGRMDEIKGAKLKYPVLGHFLTKFGHFLQRMGRCNLL